MVFSDIPAGASVFLDANAFVFHFQPHPQFGPACQQLLRRIENHELAGFTSTHVLTEAAHRLMTLEAGVRFGWSSKIVQRLKQDPSRLQQLTSFSQAIARIPQFGVEILPIPTLLPAEAALLSIQVGLLSSDALLVAVMRQNGLSHLASHDADFDRAPHIVRYAPA